MATRNREFRYRTIADDLRRQISAGELPSGAVLPSEAALAGSHEVSRVTVRKALEVLREEGLVDSRQGFGWFVAGATVRQALGTLATIESQLAAQGRTPARRVLSFQLVGDTLEVVRLNLADGQPFAVVTVWCPADLGGALSRDDVESSTFYDLLPVEFGHASQTIGAAIATALDAERLNVPVGSALLVAQRTTHDTGGNAILRSEHRFPAHLTEFSVEMSSPETGIAPAGLRLVQT